MFAILLLSVALAADWPQFLGPNRDGSTLETIASNWDSAAPKETWSTPAGAGFAGPVVVDGIAILFERHGAAEVLTAVDSSSGKVRWQSQSPTAYRDDFGFDEGPRSTPCVSDGKIYAMGAEGLVRCVSLADGKEIWAVDTRKKFGAGKGFFGMACSPLLVGGNVLLSIGGSPGAGIVALDRQTGALRWKATDDEAGYSSPASAPDFTAFFTRAGLVLLDPRDGRVLAEKHWRSRGNASVNAAAPLIVSNLVFVTASYGTGALLAKFDGSELKEIWSGDDAISSHYSTPVYRRGFLFGFHGRQEMGQSFRCVELLSGRVRWEAAFGAGSVTLAGERLLILKENGELILAPASDDRFTVTGRAQILGAGTRAFPAVSGHRFFARDPRKWVCVELP